MRLIDADKLKAHYAWWKGGSREMTMDEAKSDFDTIIDLQPTVDVVPAEDYRSMEQTVYKLTQALAEAEPTKHGVIELTYEEYGELCSYALADELKHGEWLIDKSGSLMCSKCGTLLDEAQKPSRYCPNCGARMDEVEK